MAVGIAGAPPSWDDSTPMDPQPAAPKLPPMPQSAPPPPAAPEPSPGAAAVPSGPAPAADVPPPPSYDDTEAAPGFDDTAPAAVGDVLPPPASNAALKKYVGNNLQIYNALNAGQSPDTAHGQVKSQAPAKSFMEALEAGWQFSTAGLAWREQMPNLVLPENASRALRIANQIGTFAGDLPAMVAGGFFGGAAGGAAGTVTLPVVGTVGGAAVGAGAGAFALPAAMRKIMVDHYQKGDIKNGADFVDRLMSTSWEAAKGAITGGATAVAGPLGASVGGPLVGFGAELATMTSVGSAMEGHLPNAQDFIDGAIVMGGLHGAHVIAPKLGNIFAQTGEKPADVAAAADRDVVLKQQFLTEDPTSPPQAHPTDLVYPEPPAAPAEGEGPKPTKDELMAQAQPGLEPQSQDVPPPPPPAPETERTPEAAEVLSKIGVQPDAPKGTVKDSFDKFYAASVDYLDPINAALADAKENGVEIPSEKNAYQMGRLFASHLDKVRSFLENGTRDFNSREINGEGLNQIYRDIPGGDLDGFKAYAMAKRALELDERGINPWENFSRANAEEVVVQGAEKYEAVNQRRVDFENRVLGYAKDAGLFSDKQLDAMKAMNQQHIPFYRVQDPDTWTGKAAGGTAVKRIYGSDRAILDPIASTFKNVEMLIRKADANAIRSTFVDTMETEEMRGTYIKRAENQMLPVAVSDKELSQHLRKQGVELAADELNPLTVFRPEKGHLGDNQFAVYKDGQRIVYEGAPGVVDSLRRLDGNAPVLDMWGKVLQNFARATRFGVTMDPTFGFRHFFRSQVMSGIYSQTGQVPFVHSALAMGEFMKGESEAYKNFVYDGGAVSSWDRIDENYIANNLQSVEKQYPFQMKAWNVIKKPHEATEAFIKMTDNLSRFTEYKRTLDQGGSRAEAAFNAREVTLDYQKQGLQRSLLRAGVAFIGTHINSMDRMAQAIQEDPHGTVAKMAALTAISAGLWAVNKDDEAIQALPNWQKDLYWNFRVPGASTGGKDAIIFRLPKPWSPGILFGSGAEVALDAWKGTSPSRADDFAHTLLSSVLPEPIPNAVGPVVEQWGNKSLFSGRPLVAQDKEKLLPELQYEPYTSETAKQLAKLIGYVPFVRDIGPSSDKLASPAVIENYVHGWTGTLGGWALKISDEGLQAAGVTPATVSDAKEWTDSPLARGFFSRYPSLKDQPIQDFYNNLDQTRRVQQSVAYAGKHGELATAERILAENPDMRLKLDGIAKGIKAAKQVIQNTQDNPQIGATEKRQLIDSMLFQVHSMAKMGNQMMTNFSNATKEKGAEQ